MRPVNVRTQIRISCIICAFNEAPRIAAVLRVAVGHPLLHEVIVVNDGSTDDTAAVARQFPTIKLISSSTNRGKSAAMATGIEAAEGDLLMFLDADLMGLSADDISALAVPVVSGEVEVSISLRRNSLSIFRAIGLDFVSGERVIRKELLGGLLEDIRRLPRFGVEVFMNRHIIQRRLAVAVIRWPAVSQSRKTEKLGLLRGSLAEWRMVCDLLTVVHPSVLVLQSCQLISLQVNRRGALKTALAVLNPGFGTR